MTVLMWAGVALVALCAVTLLVLRVTDRPEPLPEPAGWVGCEMHGCLYRASDRKWMRQTSDLVHVCAGHADEGRAKGWWA